MRIAYDTMIHICIVFIQRRRHHIHKNTTIFIIQVHKKKKTLKRKIT